MLKNIRLIGLFFLFSTYITQLIFLKHIISEIEQQHDELFIVNFIIKVCFEFI
jgi:hypothetical protein